jgi:hypothetical protein
MEAVAVAVDGFAGAAEAACATCAAGSAAATLLWSSDRAINKDAKAQSSVTQAVKPPISASRRGQRAALAGLGMADAEVRLVALRELSSVDRMLTRSAASGGAWSRSSMPANRLGRSSEGRPDALPGERELVERACARP